MNWNDVSLRKWNEIETIFKGEYEDDILQTADLIKVVFDIEDPMSMSPQEFQKYVHELEFIKTEIPQRKLLNVYTINGTKYYLNGNVYEMSMAALMDWRQYSTKEDVDYAECLSVFLIPQEHKYNDGYDIEKVVEDINSLPITDALKIFSFFQVALQLSIDIMTDYLQRLLKKTKMTKKQRMEIESKMKEAQEIWDSTYFRMH